MSALRLYPEVVAQVRDLGFIREGQNHADYGWLQSSFYAGVRLEAVVDVRFDRLK